MSQQEINALVSSEDASARKARRMQMGKLAGPITAVRVLKKEQQHDFGGKKGVSWVVITPDQKLVKATTYGGDLGKDFNLGAHNTIPVPPAESKDYRRALKGYTEVTDASQFPAFAVAAPTAEDSAPTEVKSEEQGSDETGSDNQE